MELKTLDITMMIQTAIAARRQDYEKYYGAAEGIRLAYFPADIPEGSPSTRYNTKRELAECALRDVKKFEAIREAYADGTLRLTFGE